MACELKGDVWLNSGYLFTQSFEPLLLLQPSATSCKRIVPPPPALLMSDPYVLSKAMLDTGNAGWAVLVPQN